MNTNTNDGKCLILVLIGLTLVNVVEDNLKNWIHRKNMVGIRYTKDGGV